MPVRVRWQYGNGYKNQKLFYRAIKKYGWKNIEHIILYENLSLEEAFKIEEKLIKEYNCCDPMYGYNVSTGGECGAKGVKLSEEQRKQISERQKGRKLSEEAARKLIESHTGRPVSLETRKKISEKRKGKKMPEESRQKMISSLKEYYKTHKHPLTGVPFPEERKKKISESKKGIPLSDEHKEKIKINHAGKRSVICLETGKVYNSIKEAALDTGANVDGICSVCRGCRKTSGKLHWSYFEK